MPSTATSILDGLSASVAVKAPCRTVATSNITLAGLQTLSGYTTVEGDRVLVKGQTNAVDNGIYMASTGTWIRSKDADGNRDLVQGTRVLIRSSTIDGVEYELTTANPIVIGTTSLTFELRYGANATYDQTEAEIAAGVTPTNYQYETLDLRRYGGDPTGAANSDTALASAIAVCGTKGGVIRAGGTHANYVFASAITLTAKLGIIIEGEAAATSGGQPGTRFTYSGTGAGVWINMDSANGCMFRGIQFTHSSASFTGTYIKVGNDGTNGDSQYCGLADCTLGGSAGAGTTHLALNKAIIFSADCCTFIFGNPSVTGQASDGSGYSNVIRFNGCTWLDNYVAPVRNPGQSWIFAGCTFQQLTTGAPGAVASTSVSAPAIGITIEGCWFGDATATAGTWVDLQGAALVFTGNYVSGNETGSTAIKLHQFVGATIRGNSFGHLLVAVNFATATSHGCSIVDNNFDTVTTTVSNPGNHSPGLQFNPNYPIQLPPTGHGQNGNNGYEISPNGNIRQWGTLDMAAAGTEAVVFLKPFPTACWQVLPGLNAAPGTNSASASNITTTGFDIAYGGTVGAATVVWQAIGN